MKAVVLSLLLVVCSAENVLKPKTLKEALKEEKERKANQSLVSNQKLTAQDIAQISAEHSTGPQKDVGDINDYLDMWYVNLKDSKDRKECMDKQIEDMGLKPHRFAAYSFKRCRSAEADDIVSCLTEKKYGDCVKGGVEWSAVRTHGSASNTELERMYKIVSNACSHKRLMAHMLKKHDMSNATKKPKYAVILEDDVAFDRKEFTRKVVNFIETYDGKLNQTWSMVQIDPFGSKCDKHIVGYFEGLPVWKPKNVNGGWECSNYWGAQALLIKYDDIPHIIREMESHPTIPLDWLPARLPTGLAWRANIALNPEASRMVHMKVPMPQYCQKSVKQSTIGGGFRQKSLARAVALAQKSGANPIDAGKVIVDPEDAEYSTLVNKYNSAEYPASYSEWMDMEDQVRAVLKESGIQ